MSRPVLSMLLIGLLCGVGFAQDAAPTDSIQLGQPIQVTIRMSNNVVVQTMLIGLDSQSITVMSPQGKTIQYVPKKVKTVRNADGTFFYTPAKDSVEDAVKQLNQLQPAGAGPRSPNGGINGQGATGAAGFTGGITAPAGGHASSPFPSGGGFSNFGRGAGGGAGAMPNMHGASPAGVNPSASMPSASSAHMGHNQSGNTTNFGPATSAMPHGTHSQSPSTSPFNSMPSSTMPPMGGHSSISPSSAMPPSMPNMPHNMTPGMTPGMGPGMAGMPQTAEFMYECSKCHHRITSPVEIKAGHKCSKCGVIWGQVKDENGRVTSSSPAARVGGGVGILFVVVAVIAAIVKKVQQA